MKHALNQPIDRDNRYGVNSSSSSWLLVWWNIHLTYCVSMSFGVFASHHFSALGCYARLFPFWYFTRAAKTVINKMDIKSNFQWKGRLKLTPFAEPRTHFARRSHPFVKWKELKWIRTPAPRPHFHHMRLNTRIKHQRIKFTTSWNYRMTSNTNLFTGRTKWNNAKGKEKRKKKFYQAAEEVLLCR